MNNKWYSAENKPLDIPTFQDLQNVTGQVFDDAGLYIGPAELPKQQLVIDNVTKRQYYAPKEYSESAIRYAEAKRNEYFKPEDWYGMEMIKPDYTIGEQVIGGAAALGKGVIGLVAQIPTKIVYTGATFANQLSKAYAMSNLTDISKMKKGMFVEQENLYRMSMKNWEKTLHKYGLINEPEIQYMTGGKIGSMIGDVGGSLLAAAVVSCVGGLPAVAAVFGSNQFADVMEEGLAKGLSHDKAFAAAWKAALAEGVLEAFGFRLWRGAATVSKSFRNKMLAFAWEGAQESSQQIAESIITNYYGIREQAFMEIMADVLLSGLVGGVVGFAGASLSGQVEQRNIALKREIGMDERGNIVPQKTTEVKKEIPEREGQTISPSPEAERRFIQQEIEEAKKTGDNKLYNIVKYSANAHGITDEATIDKMYPVARKAIADGATLDDLTDILANQIVAYNNQLDNGQTDTKATQKAVEEIKLVIDPNRKDEWLESRKSELEKAGASKREARIATKRFARTVSNLSQRLGFDITQRYDVSFEKRAPQSETLKQIKEAEETSFDFGYNVDFDLPQQGISTKGKLVEAYKGLEADLKAKKTPMPRRHLLTVLREKGAEYGNAGAIDKEAYKNARVPNRKGGIDDKLSDFLAENGFMGRGASSAESYEEASALEEEAADLIDRALNGEKIFTLADQELVEQRQAQEEGAEWAEEELKNIEKDLTRGQISFLGKVVKIALGETFDFTTLEHEFFHFLDQVVKDAAKEGNPEAQKILAKRNKIIKQAKSELKEKGFIEPKDDEERAELIKQGRRVIPIDEEILASAYEKWLWQGGKSEDAYEQRLFNAIREFFREVYDTVKGLMGIRITPEADAYFRAMTGVPAEVSYQPLADTTLFQTDIKYDKNGKADTNSPEFKKWFGDSKVVDENGKPLVVYHGSTKEFEVFDINKSNVESDLGKGFYFTNNEDDVNTNYHGGGPDFENKLDRIAERIQDEEGIDWEQAKAKAYEQEYQTDALYEVYLKMETPFVIGGNDETVLTFEEPYNEETDEYGEPEGTLLDFAYNMDNYLADFGIDYKISQELFMRATDNGGEISASEIYDILKNDENLISLLDYESSFGELLSDAVGKEYDGIIDHTVNQKFGSERKQGQSMAGMNTSTTHYIVFNPTQIKSVYNRGTFDTESPNIYYQQETNEQLYRNDQALKEGNKVLDKAPTNEQVEKELENIRNQQVGDVVITKEGFGLGESIGDFVLTLRQRVGVIDKRLKYAFDRLDFNEKMRESNYGKRVVGFIKKYRKLTETQKQELDYLINNHLSERVREFARQNDMLAEYEETRTLLDELFEEGNKAGMDMGFLQEYFPTKVNDYEGLISYLKGTDKWSKIEMALNQIDPNHQMSEEDRANAINNILRGYNRLDPVGKKGFQKERTIFHKTPEIMKFYAHADEALMRYVSGMSSALSIRTAFNVKGAFSAADSIGGIVDELIKSGKITHKEEAFITKMLRARLNYARTAPMVALLKNFGYLGTMNNLTSAITQIGDLYANFYKYNFGTAMKALFGKSEVTKQDLHIDSIWEEFSDDSWSSVAVNKLFSAIGLNKMDAFGKNTAINGAWIDLKQRLKNNDPSLLEDLTAAFGSGAKKVMEDIKNNNITEYVKLMIWSQLADTQPIGRSGVPVGYLNNPHGRIIYQLKTYTINQLSLFYADGIYKIKKGMATKNKKLFLQGIGNTAKLALLLTIFNASADALKNLIMGRKIDISDTLLSNMLWNIGVSKYTFYRGQRDGYARALLENYLLPPQISMGDDAYMDIKKIATGKRKPSDTIAVTYVPFGRMWYWWFGGGRTQEKKKGNKPFEVEL